MALADRPEVPGDGNEFLGNPQGFDYMPKKAMENMSMSQQFELSKIANTMKRASREQLFRLAMDAYALSINTRNFAGKMFVGDKTPEEIKKAGF